MGVEFKPGDVVQLRSGGPAMTVRVLEAEGKCVTVDFFDESGKRQHDMFAPAVLRVVLSEPEEFGIPEALQKAKDDEAQRLMAERDRQWAEDQVRYAHTDGFTLTSEVKP